MVVAEIVDPDHPDQRIESPRNHETTSFVSPPGGYDTMNVMPISNRDQSLRKAGLAASVLTAVGASVCCIGPIAAAVLGIGSLGGLVRYEPLRPYFTVR